MIISSWGTPCGREVQCLLVLSLLHGIQDKEVCWGLWLLRTMISTFFIFPTPEKTRVYLNSIHPTDYFLLELMSK